MPDVAERVRKEKGEMTTAEFNESLKSMLPRRAQQQYETDFRFRYDNRTYTLTVRSEQSYESMGDRQFRNANGLADPINAIRNGANITVKDSTGTELSAADRRRLAGGMATSHEDINFAHAPRTAER